MINNASAVKAKIKNKAGGNSDKSQIFLRIYLMERLLERPRKNINIISFCNKLY